MGRRAGVNPAETKAEVLRSAADAFSAKGYDGASISEIAAAAGVTKGAIYVHFASKAELFVAVVRDYGKRELQDVIGSPGGFDPDGPIGLDVYLRIAGAALGLPNDDAGTLLMEAAVASRRHPEIAEMIGRWILEDEELMTSAIEASRSDGLLASASTAPEMARLITMLALGAAVVGVLRLPPVDQQRWSRLVDEIVSAFRTPQ